MKSVTYVKLNDYEKAEGPFTDPELAKQKAQGWKQKGGYFAVTVKKKTLDGRWEYYVYTKECKKRKKV